MSEAVLEFLNSGPVLVLDAQAQSRTILRRNLMDLGVLSQNLYMANSFNDAVEYIEFKKPVAIFCDYQYEEHYGLELSLLQKEYLDDPRKRLFGLMSHSAASAAVADAADEEVDFFLLKPLNEESFRQYVENAIRRKSKPNEFSELIQGGRRLLKDDPSAAQRMFKLALAMQPNSPMCHYYIGRTHEMMGDLPAALSEFELGLLQSPLHYRCLSEKFVIQYRMMKKTEAHATLNTLSTNYPLTPELLKQAFTIVILSFRYEEVERYYQLYLNQPRKPADLKQVVSDTLLTSGRLLLVEGKVTEALTYFQKSAIIAGRPDKVLSDIVDTLLKLGRAQECRIFFDMFQPSQLSEDLLKRARFKLMVREGRPNDQIAKVGRELVFAAIADEEVCDQTIEAATKMDNKVLVEAVANKALALFPDKRSKYAKFL